MLRQTSLFLTVTEISYGTLDPSEPTSPFYYAVLAISKVLDISQIAVDGLGISDR